jgi:hypothetical protein
MSEDAAKLFVRFVTDKLRGQPEVAD